MAHLKRFRKIHFTRFYKMILIPQSKLGYSKYKTVIVLHQMVILSFEEECQFPFLSFYLSFYYYWYCISRRYNFCSFFSYDFCPLYDFFHTLPFLILFLIILFVFRYPLGWHLLITHSSLHLCRIRFFAVGWSSLLSTNLLGWSLPVRSM